MPEQAIQSRAPQNIDTSIRYVVRGEKATFYAGDRERSYWPPEDHKVTVHDMLPEREELGFDRNGFVLADHPSNISNYEDEAQLALYYKQCEELIASLTGADKVISFGAIIRTSQKGAHGHNQPAFGAHVDYGARTVEDFTRDILPEKEADRRLAGRHMLINLWRPLSKVETTPFALCDASTVSREDMFDSEIIGGLGDYGRRSLWGFNLAYNAQHKWYWRPQMPPEEVFAFKLFDSDDDAVQFTGHTAFLDPTAAPDAAPRESIELRTIAFIDG